MAKYIKVPPELNDGHTSALMDPEGLNDIGMSLECWADNAEPGATVTLTLVAMSPAEAEKLPSV